LENRNARFINQLERYLNDEKMLDEQRKLMVAFDRFNELEAGCRLSTRLGYMMTIRELALLVHKPFEEMTREDLQCYITEPES